MNPQSNSPSRRTYIVLISFLVLTWGAVGFDYYDRHTRPSLSSWPESHELKVVTGKTFRNERVPIDGHRYYDCIFENVTFVYNGTTPPDIENNNIFGSTRVSSENQAIVGAMAFLKGIGYLKSGVAVEEIPPGSKIGEPSYR